jgi:hypothetical protein
MLWSASSMTLGAPAPALLVGLAVPSALAPFAASLAATFAASFAAFAAFSASAFSAQRGAGRTTGTPVKGASDCCGFGCSGRGNGDGCTVLELPNLAVEPPNPTAAASASIAAREAPRAPPGADGCVPQKRPLEGASSVMAQAAVDAL